MVFEEAPRRQRRSWDHAAPISVRDALLNSVGNLSIVSEVDSARDEALPPSNDPPQQLSSVAWEFPTREFQSERVDAAVVQRRKTHTTRPRRQDRRTRRTWDAPGARLTGIRSRVRSAPEAMVKTGRTTDVKKVLSASRARQRVTKARREDFGKTIRHLEAKCASFRRAADAGNPVLDEEEACISEVQRAAYDRWEKAVECAKQALQEVIEAEKVLSYAAEFEQLKGMMDAQAPDWDVGVDKYIDLYKDLQREYPETTPIRRSKITRRHSFPKRVMASVADRVSELPPPRVRRDSAIPTPSRPAASRFDPNYILALGRRFAHSAEKWFLKLIHRLVGLELGHTVYCREDCYRLMESLSKLQNWLVNAKGATRTDRRDVLRTRLRDTVIRWSSQMFELPLAKTRG